MTSIYRPNKNRSERWQPFQNVDILFEFHFLHPKSIKMSVWCNPKKIIRKIEIIHWKLRMTPYLSRLYAEQWCRRYRCTHTELSSQLIFKGFQSNKNCTGSIKNAVRHDNHKKYHFTALHLRINYLRSYKKDIVQNLMLKKLCVGNFLLWIFYSVLQNVISREKKTFLLLVCYYCTGEKIAYCKCNCVPNIAYTGKPPSELCTKHEQHICIHGVTYSLTLSHIGAFINTKNCQTNS